MLQVLGEELLEEWVARTVPPDQKRQWLAANTLTITLFVAPQASALLLLAANHGCWICCLGAADNDLYSSTAALALWRIHPLLIRHQLSVRQS